jgi:hypothetical protein
LLGGHLEALPELPVVGVDVQLLAGLGVFHDQRPDVRQLHLAPVEQPDGEDLVPPAQDVERALPAGRADEVGDHEHERSALDRQLPGVEQGREVGRGRTGQPWLVEEVVD